jgi:chromosomal replication initiator protein
LEDRIKTRFEWGLIADIQPPDLELRIAIFKNKISQAGISVSDEIITFLAENLRSNIRQIEGAVKKLVALKFLEGNDITMEVVKSSMSEFLGDEEPIAVTIDKIFAAVEKRYGVSQAELKSKSRVKDIAQARHVTIYLIRAITEMSFPNIGKMFGRDHTTIMASADSIEKKIASNGAFEIEINNLIREIKE